MSAARTPRTTPAGVAVGPSVGNAPLRDFFAAAALTGVLRTTIRTDTPETIADRCYRIADALMAAREQL